MKTKYFIIGFLSCLMLFIILGVIGYKWLSNERQEMLLEENSKEISDLSFEMIEFTDDDLNGLELYSLEHSQKTDIPTDKIIFLNFWATWCKPCIAEFPSIEALKKDFDNDINFLFVSNDKKEKMLRFKEKNDYSFEYFVYDKANISSKINHSMIPCTYVIDAKNNIAYKFEGIHNFNSKLLRSFINKQLKP